MPFFVPARDVNVPPATVEPVEDITVDPTEQPVEEIRVAQQSSQPKGDAVPAHPNISGRMVILLWSQVLSPRFFFFYLCYGTTMKDLSLQGLRVSILMMNPLRTERVNF